MLFRSDKQIIASCSVKTTAPPRVKEIIDVDEWYELYKATTNDKDPRVILTQHLFKKLALRNPNHSTRINFLNAKDEQLSFVLNILNTKRKVDIDNEDSIIKQTRPQKKKPKTKSIAPVTRRSTRSKGKTIPSKVIMKLDINDDVDFNSYSFVSSSKIIEVSKTESKFENLILTHFQDFDTFANAHLKPNI